MLERGHICVSFKTTQGNASDKAEGLNVPNTRNQTFSKRVDVKTVGNSSTTFVLQRLLGKSEPTILTIYIYILKVLP